MQRTHVHASPRSPCRLSRPQPRLTITLLSHRAKRVLGVCYVVVKVSMLAVVEIGVFPLVCGWWLDVCSLTLLDTSLQASLAEQGEG